MAQSMRIAMRMPHSLGILRTASRPAQISRTSRIVAARARIHTTTPSPATVSPIHGTGPPPEAPKPAADSAEARIERRKDQAALLQRAQDIRTAAQDANPQANIAPLRTSTADRNSALLKKRFWKDVHVKEVDGALEVHLDARPLRRPNTKEIVRIPLSKPLLATALAVEWDMLVSAQQATRQHLIPLTSIVCRALDIADDDKISDSARAATAEVTKSIRSTITTTVLRYFDTDTLLCWAPPPKFDDGPGRNGMSLRETQQKAAEEIIAYMSTRVWPGVKIEPVLDEETIMPRRQELATRQIVEGWVSGLNSWELAGLERAVLAGKGLLGAARLIAEWSEGAVGIPHASGESQKFGVEEAARLSSIEVEWQTANWGEVEDTHDVEKEDLRRQFGTVVLLVGGTGRQ